MKKSELKRMIEEEVSRMTEAASSPMIELRRIRQLLEDISRQGTGVTVNDFEMIIGYSQRAIEMLNKR